MKRLLEVGLQWTNILIDTILPERARTARTNKRTLKDIPLTPESHDLLGTRVITLMDYRNPAVQDLIRSLKYDGSQHAAQLAAEIAADYLREELAASGVFSARKTCVVPVPLHKKRARERGWNQIELVLKALPEEFRDGTHATLMPEALVRTRATKAQTRLPRAERLSNVEGAFAVAGVHQVRGAHVFLIDDVTTTGATLLQAAAPLRHTASQVTLLALARA